MKKSSVDGIYVDKNEIFLFNFLQNWRQQVRSYALILSSWNSWKILKRWKQQWIPHSTIHLFIVVDTHIPLDNNDHWSVVVLIWENELVESMFHGFHHYPEYVYTDFLVFTQWLSCPNSFSSLFRCVSVYTLFNIFISFRS